MRLLDAQERVASAARLVSGQESEHARDIALEGQVQKIIRDGHVSVEILGDADGTVRRIREHVGACFHLLQLLLNTPNVGQVLVENRVVARTDDALQSRCLLEH